MPTFLLITPEFATAHDGLRDGENVVDCLQTLTGQWVTAATTAVDFPALFAGQDFDAVELVPADFPVPALPGNPAARKA